MKIVVIDSRPIRSKNHRRVFSLEGIALFYLNDKSIIDGATETVVEAPSSVKFDLAVVHVGDMAHLQDINTKHIIFYGGKGYDKEDRLGSKYDKKFLFSRQVDETGGYITDAEASKLVNWVLGNEKLEDLSFLHSESKIRERLLLLHFLLTEKNSNASSIKDFLNKEKIVGFDEKSPEIERFLTSKDSHSTRLIQLRDTFLNGIEKN